MAACLLFPSAMASAQDACARFDHAHEAWTGLLSRHVDDAGLVDYAGWKARDVPALEAYLSELARVDEACFARMSAEQQIALLLNAYNASTIQLVLREHPIASIRSIGFLPGSAFRRDFIRLPALGPGEISLDDIEHETLRQRWREPRIHFALVCAARSCPPLRREAYRGRDLDAQLDDQGQRFLRDPSKNRYDAASDTMSLSRIFDWFEQDFVKAAGSVRAFVGPYLAEPAATALRSGDARIAYLDYDWSLNAQ